MLEIFVCIIIVIITFLFLHFTCPKKPILVPSTKWKHGNLKVTIIYVTMNRVYFEPADSYCIGSMDLEEFVTYFEEDIECSQQ